MAETTDWCFDVFRVDVSNACVWRGEQALKLTPKAFAVLHYLLDHAGQLVTRDALWQEVWQGVSVTDAALNMSVIEIRKALGDNARTPRFIETVHRRGYRWIASLHPRSPHLGLEARDLGLVPSFPSPKSQVSSLKSQASSIVGREAELAQLQDYLTKAVNSKQQMVFITGEPGIGKTAVVEEFLQQLGAEKEGQPTPNPRPPTPSPAPNTLTLTPLLARGYCVESYGAGEAYLPVLTALEALGRTVGCDRLLPLLQQHAPMWLAQLPSLLPPAERETLQRQLAGATGQRMLRELANFLTALTAVQPLVLVLEDLHWSDPSTVALLAYLARWPEQLPLLIVGTYRSNEVLSGKHPLAAAQGELAGQGLCTEISLSFLPEVAVADYLQQRTSDKTEISPQASTLYRQTAGHPLFMVATVEEWLAQQQAPENQHRQESQQSVFILNDQIPERFRQFVQVQMARLLRREQQVLEAASVAGYEFSAAEVAAALTTDEVSTEERCEQFTQRQQFLRPAGISEWPDGTVTARYGFQHAVYQSLWQERIKAGRWRRYHQLIGERKEAAYGGRAGEIAAELALHFEQGRDYPRAISYRRQAAQTAITRSAHSEAIKHLTNGLALLKTLPDTPERAQQELALQMALGNPLIAIKGYAAPEVEKAILRARELCEQLDDTSQLFPVLFRLWVFDLMRWGRDLRTLRKLADQLMQLAQSAQDKLLLSSAHAAQGFTLFWMGELASARPHLEQTIALYNNLQKHPPGVGTADPRVDRLSYTAWALWYLGYPNQALKRNQEVQGLAEGLSHPFSRVYDLGVSALLYLLFGNSQLARERAEAAMVLATEQGFPFWLAYGRLGWGAALAEQGQATEGIVQIKQGVAALQALGIEPPWIGHLSALVTAYAKVGKVEEGLSVVNEALERIDKTGGHLNEAELYRLKGELTLQQSRASLGQVPDKSQTSQKQSKVSSSRHPTPDILSSSLNTQHRTLNTEAEAEAEACFRKAIEVSQRQQAKSLELRATTSLARLWQSQGKQCEAHTILSELYNWFTEGFDTKDLREAKALLDELR